MVHKERSKRFFENAVINSMELELTPEGTTGTGVTAVSRFPVTRQVDLTFTGVVIPITAALDYGGVAVFTFPLSRDMIVTSTQTILVATEDGVGVTNIAATNVTLGTAVATSTGLNNDEENIINAVTPTAGGDVIATRAIDLFVAAGTNVVYANAAAVITVDGSITLDGTVRISYVDLGA